MKPRIGSLFLRLGGLVLLLLVSGLTLNTWGFASGTVEDSYFLNGYATDSGASATALATGQKTEKGNISWAAGDLPGGALETITERLRQTRGFATGVVSTVPFNHATPAGFASHNVARTNTAEIAHQIIFSTTPDVVIGGGYNSKYLPLTSPDFLSLTIGASAYTHVVIREPGVDGGAALTNAAAAVELGQGHKLFGLFGTTKGNFADHAVADSPGSPLVVQGDLQDPTLEEATLAALTVLAQDPDGFFVMIEQGDIDWSNHSNNFQTMIGGIWDLDHAVRAAEQFVEQSESLDWTNTLMVVTADHANSYMRLPIALGIGDLPLQEGKIYPDGEVTYGSTAHTNQLVTLQARGRGATLLRELAGTWYPGTRIVDNTQVYDLLRRAVEEAGARHLILFIGDGMHTQHEIAGSRYLYGSDQALAWHNWEALLDGWSGYASTWDIDTYNGHAAHRAAAAYDPAHFEATLGYDPSMERSDPVTATLTMMDGSLVSLSWLLTPALTCHYDLFSSATPYRGFSPLARGGTDTNYSSPSAHPAVNSFYYIEALACSLPLVTPVRSNTVGTFNFALKPGES